jgi:hypothetical protein
MLNPAHGARRTNAGRRHVGGRPSGATTRRWRRRSPRAPVREGRAAVPVRGPPPGDVAGRLDVVNARCQNAVCILAVQARRTFTCSSRDFTKYLRPESAATLMQAASGRFSTWWRRLGAAALT